MFYSENLSVNEQGHLTVGGHDTVALAQEFGTPLYLLDEELMRQNCRAYVQALAESYGGHGLPLYASKALCTLHTARVAAEEGMGADAVSGGEIFTLHRAGFPMEKVFFHGNNKTAEEIELAIRCGVGHFVVDNAVELALVNEIAGRLGVRQSIVFRIKPGVDAHTHDFIKTGQIDSKFGVALENGEALEIHKAAAQMPHIQVDGVHCHIGSQIFDAEPFCEAARIMLRFMAELRDQLGLSVKILDLGGGFGIRYGAEDDPPEPGAYIRLIADTVKAEAAKYGLPLPFLLFEPGRSIVASAGVTLYTVGCVKTIENVRTYVSVDGGMGDNPRYILYQAKHSAVVANNAAAAPSEIVTIAGKCCESGDLIGENVPLQPVHPGDTLAVLATGAYNYSMASNYNRIPRPPVVALRGAEKKIIVKRETYEDLIQNDL